MKFAVPVDNTAARSPLCSSSMSIDLQTFHTLRRVSEPTCSADGSYAIVSCARLGEDGSERITELWRVPLTEGGGEPRCEIVHEKSCSKPQLAEDGTLYFLSKRATPSDDAEEIAQLWRRRPDGHTEPVSDEPLGVADYRLRANTLVLLAPTRLGVPRDELRARVRDQKSSGPSGRLYTQLPIRRWDHWTADTALQLVQLSPDRETRTELTPDFDQELANAHGLVWDLSASGDALVTVCTRPGPDRQEDSCILLIDLKTGAQHRFGEEDRLTYHDALLSPSGRRIACVEHRREAGTQGALRLVLFDRETGEKRYLASDTSWVPSLAAWQDEDRLLVQAPWRGDVPLFRLSLASQSVERITASAAGGSHESISCVGNTAVGMRHTLRQPPELFRVALESEAQPEILSALSGMPSDFEMQVERCECVGAGGSPVQYFVLGGPSEGPRPTLLWIHGGPVSAWADGWHWRWCALPFLAAGFAVALPNPRGSTGYGQDFIEGVANNQWGAACYEDLMAVSDALCAREDVHANRLVAMGGSFGGYMSNWIGTQTDRFAAIITHASLYRLSAFHGTTDFPAYWAHNMGLYPSDDPEAYDRYSPHRYVDRWTTPVLITHGEKDYRVPISEGLMLFEDLHRREVDVQFLSFPDENHWILRPRNSRQWYQACLDFLSSRLLSRAAK